jgi:hypothetical protein
MDTGTGGTSSTAGSGGTSNGSAGSVASGGGGQGAAGMTVTNKDGGGQSTGGMDSGTTHVPEGGLGLCDPSKWSIANIPPVGTPGVDYLSDLTPLAGGQNGLGPFEKDMSNGGEAAGDGGPLVINKVCYPKGLGVRGVFQQRYDLGGKYKQFISDSGWDYSAGMVRPLFRVWVDDVEVQDHLNALPANTSQETITLDVTGKKTIQVRMDAFDLDNTKCFGVWGGARLVK